MTSTLRTQAAFHIKSSWRVTNCGKHCADLPGHFSPVCCFRVILQAMAQCQTQMKPDTFSSVDRSTVNRDFSVAESSFNLKLDLVLQMVVVWNCRQYITGLTSDI